MRRPMPCGGTTGSAAPYAPSAPAGAAAAAASVSSPFMPVRRVIFTGRILRFSAGPGCTLWRSWRAACRLARHADTRCGNSSSSATRSWMRFARAIGVRSKPCSRRTSCRSTSSVTGSAKSRSSPRSRRGEFQIERLWFESLSVEQFDETAVVCGVQRAQVRLPAGDRVEGRTAFTDVFVRAADGWRLRLATSAELALGGMP